jgi:hypothetical protein
VARPGMEYVRWTEVNMSLRGDMMTMIVDSVVENVWEDDAERSGGFDFATRPELEYVTW